MNQYLIIIGAIVGAFLAGRYSAPDKIKIETVTVTKEVQVKDESQRVNQIERVIETTYPDGRAVKETRIKTRAAMRRSESKAVEIATKENREIENRRGVVVSALMGLPFSSLSDGPVYGAAFQKKFIGPISIGAWMLTNLTFGLSVGLEL